MDMDTFHHVLDLHSQTLQDIIEQEYYLDQLYETLEHMGVSLENAYHITDPGLIQQFWNYYWFRLPDSKDIRRGPFFSICDLAEGDYLYEEDE